MCYICIYLYSYRIYSADIHNVCLITLPASPTVDNVSEQAKDADNLPSVDEYVKNIRDANPQLAHGSSDPIRGLAVLYRQLDYNEGVLQANPGDRTASNEYIKLRTLAIRHEITLGIVTKGSDPADPEPFPTSGRRPQRREFGAS